MTASQLADPRVGPGTDRPVHRRRRVVVVDDHPLVGAALVAALRTRGLDARHVDPADLGDGPGAGPGLVVLDLDLGRDAHGRVLDGVALVPDLREAGWAVLVLSGTADRERFGAAVAAGALGWLRKSARFDALLDGVVAAADGRPVLDPAERERVLAEHRSRHRERSALQERWARLTPREREVLGRLAAGQRAAAIAAESVVSLATVRTQIRSVLTKLEVGSQLEAVALAQRHAG